LHVYGARLRPRQAVPVLEAAVCSIFLASFYVSFSDQASRCFIVFLHYLQKSVAQKMVDYD